MELLIVDEDHDANAQIIIKTGYSQGWRGKNRKTMVVSYYYIILALKYGYTETLYTANPKLKVVINTNIITFLLDNSKQ